jgi:hypothetical protein
LAHRERDGARAYALTRHASATCVAASGNLPQMDDFLQRVRDHDWAGEPQMPHDSIELVPAALESAWRHEPRAYENLRAALGNHTVDSWFPVLLGAMPFLAEIIARGPGAGASAVMYLLGYYTRRCHVDFEELDKVRARELAFREILRTLPPLLSTIATSGRSDASEAAELMDDIDARLRSQHWFAPGS